MKTTTKDTIKKTPQAFGNPQILKQQDINEMDKKIALLKERAKLSEGRAQKGFEDQMRALEDQFELLKARFGEAEQKAKSASSEMTTGFKEAWGKLKDSVEKASSQLH